MRIIVDSGVWIDLFTDRDTLETRFIRDLLTDKHDLLVGDLVLAEVLQGTRDERHFNRIVARLAAFDPIVVCGEQVAVQAAKFYLLLRARGITIRKTIDTLIATRCILDDIPLLFADRDFLPFVEHLNLRSALLDTGLN